MSLPFFLAGLVFVDQIRAQYVGETHWNLLKTNFPSFIGAPITESAAISQGWEEMMVCGDEGAPGNLYAFEGDLSAMPFFNADGNIAGIILGMEDPGALVHRAPYTPYTTFNGSTFWGIEANFRDPETICTEGSTGDVTFGDRLWFANGSHTQYSKTPLTQNVGELEAEGWVLGACKAFPFQMGTHWWRYSAENISCNESYPIFLLYDDDDRLHAWGVAMGNSDRPALDGDDNANGRWEHPAGGSLESFFAEGGFPICLWPIEAVNSQHVYMTNNSATTCTTSSAPTTSVLPSISPTTQPTVDSSASEDEDGSAESGDGENGLSAGYIVLMVVLFLLGLVAGVCIDRYILRRNKTATAHFVETQGNPNDAEL